jgi:hypothetical protein
MKELKLKAEKLPIQPNHATPKKPLRRKKSTETPEITSEKPSKGSKKKRKREKEEKESEINRPPKKKKLNPNEDKRPRLSSPKETIPTVVLKCAPAGREGEEKHNTRLEAILSQFLIFNSETNQLIDRLQTSLSGTTGACFEIEGGPSYNYNSSGQRRSLWQAKPQTPHWSH